MLQLLIAVGLVTLLAIAFFNRKKEKEEFVREEREEERGKYWDSEEQSWTSKREQSVREERKATYLQGSTAILKKQLLAFAYEQNPALANLDSKGFAQLDGALAKHAQAIVEEVERIKQASLR